jgi:hypothetical protein
LRSEVAIAIAKRRAHCWTPVEYRDRDHSPTLIQAPALVDALHDVEIAFGILRHEIEDLRPSSDDPRDDAYCAALDDVMELIW